MITKKIHKDRDEVLRFCNSYQRIYIYGADLYAGFFLRYLQEENIDIAGFIVSDGYRRNEYLNGYKVMELSELELTDRDGIILGVKLDTQKEIKKILIEKGLDIGQIYAQRIYCAQENFDMCLRYCDFLTGKVEDVVNDGFFSKYKDLDDMGTKYGTDKCSEFHNFLNKYEFFLKERKNQAFNFLELGIANGSSLKTWEEFFPEATIYGVDIAEECKNLEGDRRKVLIMDLGDMESLEKLKEISPAIIVDDATHMWSHQLKALFSLLPTLPSGGIYILEDIETSFPAYRDYFYDDSSVSTYEVCSQLASVVCGKEVIKQSDVSANIWAIKDEIEELALQIEMISFIYGSCIIVKR